MIFLKPFKKFNHTVMNHKIRFELRSKSYFFFQSTINCCFQTLNSNTSLPYLSQELGETANRRRFTFENKKISSENIKANFKKNILYDERRLCWYAIRRFRAKRYLTWPFQSWIYLTSQGVILRWTSTSNYNITVYYP